MVSKTGGDTIIEVMLAVAIFGLVLVVTITSANRSLRSGTDATLRQEALTLDQQQVELIKNALLFPDLKTLQTYTNAASPFCISASDGSVQHPPTNPSAPNNPCHVTNVNGSATDFNVTITSKAGSDKSTVFTVTTTWQSSISRATDSAYVYYKVPQAGPKPPIVTACGASVTTSIAPGAATLSGTIDPNGSATTWHFSYGTSPSLGTNVPIPDSMIAANAGPTAVSESINNLAAGNYYFTLVATNSDGSGHCDSDETFTIAAPPPPSPVVSLTANPISINPGDNSTLSWSSTNATSCSAVSPAGWTSSTATNGSQSVSPSSTTTYTISCSGAGGVAESNATLIVSASSTPTVVLISVTHDLSNDTYHNAGTVNPNNTPSTHPYISIGRTCDSGSDADNPGSRFNSAISTYENPLGPFSDATVHNEREDMQDTQFSFYFCGFNNPYKFQQCAWWGTDITQWQTNHVCSNEIDLYSGSGSGTGGGGGSGGGGTGGGTSQHPPITIFTFNSAGIWNQGPECFSPGNWWNDTWWCRNNGKTTTTYPGGNPGCADGVHAWTSCDIFWGATAVGNGYNDTSTITCTVSSAYGPFATAGASYHTARVGWVGGGNGNPNGFNLVCSDPYVSPATATGNFP